MLAHERGDAAEVLALLERGLSAREGPAALGAGDGRARAAGRGSRGRRARAVRVARAGGLRRRAAQPALDRDAWSSSRCCARSSATRRGRAPCATCSRRSSTTTACCRWRSATADPRAGRSRAWPRRSAAATTRSRSTAKPSRPRARWARGRCRRASPSISVSCLSARDPRRAKPLLEESARLAAELGMAGLVRYSNESARR